MRRAVDEGRAVRIVQTAPQTHCPPCGKALHISQHRDRFVFRLDELVHNIDRDKRCPDKDCVGRGVIYRPPQDIRLALPKMSYGLDVVVWVGEGHLVRGESLRQMGRDLNERGVPIDQTQVGELLRTYLVLCRLCRGDEEAQRRRLREQGGIVLMVDGVQYDDRSPVLYLGWDAVSGAPLFGERKEFRAEADLRPFMERVKAMEVPVIGIVTDKEKGLVPAIEAVFPGVPYQFCHTHFLRNCAKPMESDLSELGASVADRAERVQKLAKRLHESQSPLRRQPKRSAPVIPTTPLAAQQVPAPPTTGEVSAAVRGAAAPEPGGAAAPEPGGAAAPEPGGAAAPEPGGAAAPEPAVASCAPSASPTGGEEPTASLSEAHLVRQLCAAVRANARISGKAPLDPPALRRHERLESIRQTVHQARQKKSPDPAARCPP